MTLGQSADAKVKGTSWFSHCIFFSFAANGNESKTYKGDRSTCGPSRVLHVRKVPIEVSEAEVISLGIPFGKVTNLLMLKGKNQVRTRGPLFLYLT